MGNTLASKGLGVHSTRRVAVAPIGEHELALVTRAPQIVGPRGRDGAALVRASRLQAEERLYLAAAAELLAVIRELGGASRHLMVVGHNPGITESANRLSAGETIDDMPTCAVFTARLDIADWKELDWGLCEEAEFDYPRKAT